MSLQKRLLALPLLAATAVVAEPSGGCNQDATLTSGVQTINVNGQDRQYTLRVPEGYDSSNPYRLIFGVHWWGGSMEDVATGQTVEAGTFNYYGLERLAEETAIFVAPNGIDGSWYNEGGQDMAFLDEVNRQVEEGLCVDTDLRFSIGFSWGGSTSVALACRSGDYTYRAIAAIGAAGPYECDPGTEPRGYLGIHGTQDNPDNGRSMRDRFIANNGCSGEETPEAAPGSPHVKTEYECSGPPVTWITHAGGHIAAPHDGGDGDSGDTFVSPEAWEFFSQF